MFVALVVGSRLRRRHERTPAQRGPGGRPPRAVIAVSTLLALLLGLSFNLAIERFEARRLRVLDQANAIDSYLADRQSQLAQRRPPIHDE